jgi:RNase P/RNase MRP subunit POP5
MVVKDKRGRRRYIAFVLTQGGPITKGGLITLLREASRERGVEEPRVIQFDGAKGIMRCSHLRKEETVNILVSLGERKKGIEVKTLSTSGTLRKLREQYFDSED